MVADARLSSPNAGQGGTLRDVPGPFILPGTSENEGFVHDTIAVLKYLWNIIGNTSLPPSNDEPPPPAISPSGQTGSPTGPEDPNGNPTQPLNPRNVGDQNNTIISKQQALANVLDEIKQSGAQVVSDIDAQAYLDSRARAYGLAPDEVHAVTVGDSILVRPQYASDPLVLREELIHVYQQTTGSVSSINISDLEIAAREQMIQNANKWGITSNEIEKLQAEINILKLGIK